MVDGVFLLVLTRTDERKCAFGLGGREHTRFSGDMAGRLQHNEFAITRAPRAQIEALIILLKNQHIGSVRRAERVPPKLVLALLLRVLDGIKQGPIVGGPDKGACALDRARKRLAGFQILYAQRVLAKAGGVSGVGQPAAVAGNVSGADGEEGVTLGQLIAVEDDLFLRGGTLIGVCGIPP